MAERAQRYQASLRRIPCLQHLTQASCSTLLALSCCGGRWQRLRGGAQRQRMPCSTCARARGRDRPGPEATNHPACIDRRLLHGAGSPAVNSPPLVATRSDQCNVLLARVAVQEQLAAIADCLEQESFEVTA